jgi:hypothetical protein
MRASTDFGVPGGQATVHGSLPPLDSAAECRSNFNMLVLDIIQSENGVM